MKQLVTDDLWKHVRPHLPEHPTSRKGGRPRADDRACLEAIVFVLRSGCQWQLLPDKQFGVSGSTCWRRFAEWTAAGVWPRVHHDLLDRLGLAGRVDLSAAAIDSQSVRAVFGGRTPARVPSTAGNAGASATRSPTPGARRC
jgi:transposase